MSKRIEYESMPLAELSRAKRGTKAIFVGDLKDDWRIRNLINTQFRFVGGKAKTEDFVSICPRTGDTKIMMEATVVKPGRALRKPGRKPAQ